MSRRDDWWDTHEPRVGCALALALLVGAAMMVWAAIIAAAAALSACAAAPAAPQLLEQVSAQAITRDDLTPRLALRAMSEASYLPDQFATAHVHHMPELADV